MRTVLSRLSAAALDLVAPPACLACGAGRQERAALCRRCLLHVRPAPRDPCPRCAGRLGPGADPSACSTCGALRPKFRAAVAAGAYPGLLGEMVRRAKYGRDPLLGTPLSDLLSDAVGRWDGRAGITAVAAVPGTAARVRERGFHLADLLAERLADDLHVPIASRRIERIGEPVPQAALPRTERRRAARGTVRALAPRWPWETRVAGAIVLVVDDVLTTGATVNECARVLLAAGAAEVRVAVCARA